MNVFITGSEGFIGKELRRQCLESGLTVAGVDLAPPTWEWGVQADLCDRPAWYKFLRLETALVHLAAVSTQQLCQAQPLGALAANVRGVLEVLQAAHFVGCRQVVFASTELVYRDSPAEQDESTRPVPSGVYAESKLLGEQLCRLSGLPNVTVMRFGITYGPRRSNWCAVESLVDKVRRGEPIEVGNVTTARRFVHVRDLCAGIRASFGRTGHEIFNLPGKRLVPLGEIVETARHFTGRAVSITDKGERPSVRIPCGRKARSALGWEPQVELAEGVDGLLDYFGAEAGK